MSTKFFLSDECLAILQSLPFGVYVCDNNCIVRFINDAYAGYLGYTPEQITGHSIFDFIVHSRAKKIMQSRKCELYDESSVLPGTANNHILVNRIPLINSNNEVIGYFSQLLSTGDKEWTAVFNRMDMAQNALRKLKFLSSEKSVQKQYEIIGASPIIKECIDRTERYAATDESILIVGPTGAGKELFARAAHNGSSRAEKPLISLNCATFSREFINSELFGYAPGAFTGASKNGKAGLMELADGGTLFLDEIGELPLEVQGALLRALETHTIQRVNDLRPRKVNFRLISATNRNLLDMVKKNLFRADLYYRISVLNIDIPPLANRREDIVLLIQHFLEALPVPSVTIDKECLNFLLQYSWPGNVRELRNVITCAAINSDYQRILKQHLPASLLENYIPTPPLPPKKTDSFSRTQTGEKEIILQVLREQQGNITKTARELRMSRTTLYKKIAAYGIFNNFADNTLN